MAKKRARRGRPAGTTTPHNNGLSIRLTTNQRRLFERRAALSGLTTSAWARMILLREVAPKGSE